MNRRALLVGGASVALGSIGVIAWKRRNAPPSREARVENALLESFPNPVSLSPDGTKLLVKSFFRSSFELAVIDRATRQVVASDRMPDTQLSPTWSPDGRTVAFFADHAGSARYDLFTLDARSSQRRRIDAPQTTQTALRWSPRGLRLAYFQGESGHRELVVNDPERNVIVLDDVAPKAGFDWSPDGTHLATVRRADEGAVAIARAKGGVERSITVVPGGTVHGITWSDDALLVTCSPNGGDWYGVAHVDPSTSAVTMIATPPTDLSGPLVFPKGFLFHENVDGDVVVRACGRDGGDVRTIGFHEGHSIVTGVSPDGMLARVLYTSRHEPPALYEVAMDGDAAILVGAGHFENRPPIAVERIDVRATDGVVSPTYAWRSPRRARRALVRIHGGPNGQSMKAWQAPTDLLVRAGFDVLSPNYRGSSGYGLAFERAGTTAERVSDILAACDHAISVLGAERIYLWGHSYGAELALSAALAAPTKIAGVALLSLTGRPMVPTSVDVPALAFHGAADATMAANDARAVVSACFGPRASFTVFPNEGHSFTRVETWTRVYASVLGWLDHS